MSARTVEALKMCSADVVSRVAERMKVTRKRTTNRITTPMLNRIGINRGFRGAGS